MCDIYVTVSACGWWRGEGEIGGGGAGGVMNSISEEQLKLINCRALGN